MTDFSGELFAALQRLLPQHTLSRLAAKLAEAETPWLKNWLIRQFISHYQVDLGEALISNPKEYCNFNAFFTRHLKSECRPICEDEGTIACPVDGTISQIGQLDGNQLLQAKGQTYSLEQLVGNIEDAKPFIDGHFATIYLSPKDYHRVHMPIAGQLEKSRYIPGKLFSVNQTTTEQIPNLFSNNERLVCQFDTDIGKVVVILVGAMLVAGIGTRWRPQFQPAPGFVIEESFTQEETMRFEKGGELGYFNFGSTVILLFEDNAIEWRPDFMPGTATQLGEVLATR